MIETELTAPPAPKLARHRHWPLAAMAVSILLAIWCALDLTYVLVGAEDDYATHADVIIVLGCNIGNQGGTTPCISARAGHAAELYKKGLAARIIASGGHTAGTENPTESQVLAATLEQDGVPQSAVIQENQALDTIQNLALSQAIMRAHGWNSAILVTEPFHIKRSTLIAHDDGMVVFPSPAIDSINWRDFPLNALNVARDTGSLMLYQLKSLVGSRS